MLLGEEFLCFWQKWSSNYMEGLIMWLSEFLSIWPCFSQLSLVGSILLPFGTWHSSIWKSIYSGKETNSNKTAGILEDTVHHLVLHSQYALFFRELPGQLSRRAALGNAFSYLFMSTSLHLFYFSPSFLSPLSFLPSPLHFPSFLPLVHISSVLFHLDLKAQKK